MTRRSEFVSYVIELLAPLGAVRARAMFGGWGLYCDDLFFAIVVDDVLYLKADAQVRERYVAAGQRPFTVTMRGAPQQMDYYTVPDAALDDRDELAAWVRLALAAARRKAVGKTRRTRRQTGGSSGKED